MPLRIFQVDAFTNKAFSGNPAAVCILPEPGDESWIQNVAREMNLSETAFLYRKDDGYDLRWFTPTTEVDLCGHATLAGAHILWEEGHVSPEDTIRFYTRSGLLAATRRHDWIELDFPAEPAESVPMPAELAEALGVMPDHVGRNRLDYLVVIDSEQTLRGLNPDLALLSQVPCRGVIVTSQSISPEYDFVSRFFGPRVGVDEDPVTGSAHCCLGPFWSTLLNKTELIGYQASRRGGVVRVRLGDNRVYLGGQAVTVMRGDLV